MSRTDSGSFDIALLAAAGHVLPAVRRGPVDGPCVLILQPLFEEMNRCRRFLADFGVALAAHGISSLLPDLPGEGESESDVCDADVWDAVIDALPPPAAIVAMRGGCLLGPASTNRFAIAAPESGAALFRDMTRAQGFAELEATGTIVSAAAYTARIMAGETLMLSGYPVTPALYRSLADRTAVAAKPIDFQGAPIWRQADPRRETAEASRLARLVAASIQT